VVGEAGRRDEDHCAADLAVSIQWVPANSDPAVSRAYVTRDGAEILNGDF
jgi:hypothetical protein